MIKRILREPLLHFLILGGLLFALYGWVGGRAPPPPDEIVIDSVLVETLKGQFQRTWQRPPTEQELQGLIDSWLREEVFYREGLALGLDRGDPVVRRRIALKMEFISEGLAVAPPADDELEAWFAAHKDSYRSDATFSFRQAYFDPGRFDDGWAGAVAAARAALDSGAEPQAASGSLLPAVMENAPLSAVRRTFGTDFSGSVAAAPVGRWFGPVRSGYGVHLVFVEAHTPGTVPPLDDVRKRVEADLLAQRREKAQNMLYESLRARYSIRYDGVPAPHKPDADYAGVSGSP